MNDQELTEETLTRCERCGASIVKYSDFTGLLPTEDGMRSHTSLVCERTHIARQAEAERDAAIQRAEKAEAEAARVREINRALAIELEATTKELVRLTTPRPIAEAPKDREVLVLWDGLPLVEVMANVDGKGWMGYGDSVPWASQPTHWLPLPVTKEPR